MLADDAALGRSTGGARENGLVAGLSPEHCMVSMSTIAVATADRIAAIIVSRDSASLRSPAFGPPGGSGGCQTVLMVAAGDLQTFKYGIHGLCISQRDVLRGTRRPLQSG